MRRQFFRAAMLTIVSFALATTSLAWERGGYGLKVNVNGDINSDHKNPLLTSMKIEAVEPGSPGALAGIVVGDEIIEVAGLAVFSRRASEILPLMQKQVGQSVDVKIKRSDGSVFAVTMVAVPLTNPK
jgi:C-terminal processing protease CtpA/Prc